MFDLDVNLWTATLRLALAMGVGALIGWDRESRQRPAGLRTHILVCLGAAILGVIAAGLLADGTDPVPDHIRIDPTRILAAVVGGIGFLGAGAIMRRGDRVRGLTTAAGLWVAAALGLASGIGAYALTLIGAALTFITIVILRHFDHAIQDNQTDDPES